MTRRLLTFLTAAPAILAALPLLLMTGPSHAQGTPITQGEGVSILQTDFDFDGNATDISSSGVLDVNIAALQTGSGLSSGYLNVADSHGNWVVQNLPILPGMPSGEISTAFNLGTADGTTDTSLQEAVDFSATPLTSFTPSGLTGFSVTQELYNDEGEGTPGTTAPTLNGATGALSFQAGGLFKIAFEAGHLNLQSADNQCGPAALANELTYLKTTYGLNIPDANVPGRGQPSNGNLTVPDGLTPPGEKAGNSLVGQLDLSISRPSTARTSGNTTTGAQQLNGLLQYIGSNRVNQGGAVTFQQQGINGGNNVTVATQNGNLVATGKGANVTPDFIFSQLQAGSTVKMGISGHAIDVVGAGSVLGVPFIFYQSDHQQTPQNDAKDTLGANRVDFAFLANNAVGSLALFGETGTPIALNDIVITAAPEPSAVAGFLLGAFGLGALALRARRHTARH